MADGENKEPQHAHDAHMNGTSEGDKKDAMNSKVGHESVSTAVGDKRKGDADASEQASKKIKTEGEDGGKPPTPKKANPPALKPAASSDDDDDDKPLALMKKVKPPTPAAAPKKPKPATDDSDDEPIRKKIKDDKKKSPVSDKKKKKKVKEQSSSSDSSSDSDSSSNSDSDDSSSKKKKVRLHRISLVAYHISIAFFERFVVTTVCIFSLFSCHWSSTTMCIGQQAIAWVHTFFWFYPSFWAESASYHGCEWCKAEIKALKSTQVSEQAQACDILKEGDFEGLAH
jgi:hypothetical protein